MKNCKHVVPILGAFCLMASLSFMPKEAWAESSLAPISQQQGSYQLTGTILDGMGEPVIGANVLVKGTTNGVVTDLNGKFSLQVKPNDILQISYIGYNSQEVAVKGQHTLNITLKEDVESLDEVVVVGYGTMKKKDLTGSVSSVKADELTAFTVANPVQALQGRVPGVVLSQNTGDPSGDYSIRIPSKYPIENIKKIIGEEPNQVVTHGAGWAKIIVDEKVLNIVTLHTWPQQWAFLTEDQEASKAENGGDKYRRMEIEYICKHTIGTSTNATNEYWMMMGDFNSRNRTDNAIYRYPEDSPKFLTQDYIAQETPYVDVIAKKYPNEFKTTTGKEARIDYVYCTQPLFDIIQYADVITDEYTKPVRDPKELSNFWWPSDHRPIIIDFDLSKLK